MVSQNRPTKKAGGPYAVAIAIAALGGLSLWYWGSPNRDFLEQQEQYRRSRDGVDAAVAGTLDSRGTRIAERYVSAYQSGACSQVIELTWWMQERLHAVSGLGSDERGAAMEDLCELVKDRSMEANRLRPLGTEDQYVFTPLAQVEVTGVDDGRDDLVKPVMERVWMRVSYPVPTQALRDETGAPIKSLKVGVNVSSDEYVLKAGAIGNLEIDFESISYNW